MSELTQVYVERRDDSEGRQELILESTEERDVRWFKVYHGAFFLNMEAESLGLLEPVPDAIPSGSRLQLKRFAGVNPEQLRRMRFTETNQDRPERK